MGKGIVAAMILVMSARLIPAQSSLSPYTRGITFVNSKPAGRSKL